MRRCYRPPEEDRDLFLTVLDRLEPHVQEVHDLDGRPLPFTELRQPSQWGGLCASMHAIVRGPEGQRLLELFEQGALCHAWLTEEDIQSLGPAAASLVPDSE